MSIQKLPPNNIEAEEAFLGSLLIDDSIINDVSDFLKPEHFYREQNGWIYKAILKLKEKGEPVDLITITDELRKNKQLEEAGGEYYIIGLINTVPTSINGVSYAKIIESCATRRKMIESASAIATLAYEESLEISDVIEKAEQAVTDFGDRRVDSSVIDARGVADRYLDYLSSGGPIGVSTGYTEYDKFLGGGLASPFVHIFASRPGMGKSAILTGIICHNIFKMKKNVLIFSLEMTANQIVQRIISYITGIDSNKIREGRLTEAEQRAINKVVMRISESGLFIDETSGLTPSIARSRALRISSSYGLDIIMYDHLHLMEPDGGGGGNEVRDLSQISKRINQTSKELDVPSVVASQLNRSVENRQDKRPQLADLRSSGAIEQDAYTVTMLYRDDYYNKIDSDRKGLAELIIEKNRDGSQGTVELGWNPRMASFMNINRRIISNIRT